MSQIDRRCFIQGVELARKYGALFWHIEYIDNDGSVPIEVKGMAPYKHFLEPYTRILDLTLATDTLLAQMHEK